MSIITNIENILEVPRKITLSEEVNLLLEIKVNRLMNNTDKGRIYRGIHQVRTRPINGTIVDKNRQIWMLEYNFKAYPSTEQKRHYGYVLYEDPKKDIIQVFCDCLDFWYRLHAPFVRKKLATWNLPLLYKNKQKMANPTPHTKQWTIVRNPSGNLYCCKHLYALLHGYKLEQ